MRNTSARADQVLLDVPLATDAAGRVLAPAYVNGHGPYRFIVDSGASQCAISRDLVTRLALPRAGKAAVSVSTTTGRSSAPVAQIESFEVGTLRMGRLSMPVIEASTAQSGVVGVNALMGKQLDVDFVRRRVMLSADANPPAHGPFVTTLSVEQRFGGLLLAIGSVRGVGCKLIVDTGAQTTIGNLALARRLDAEVDVERPIDPLIVQTPEATLALARLPSAVPISVGAGGGKSPAATLSIACADLPIFALWELAEEPAALLGMDFLARQSRFVIDYRRSLLTIQNR
jgi:predicted aspartyl protease